MAGAVLLSIFPAFAMEEKGKWIEMKDFSQRTKMYENVDMPDSLRRNTKNLTADGWKKANVGKNVLNYTTSYYRNHHSAMKYFPLFYYDYSIVWM